MVLTSLAIMSLGLVAAMGVTLPVRMDANVGCAFDGAGPAAGEHSPEGEDGARWAAPCGEERRTEVTRKPTISTGNRQERRHQAP